jgi:hypothetical protein
LDEVLEEVEEAAIPREAPASIVAAVAAGRHVLDVSAGLLAQNADRLDRLCVFLAADGDPRFARKLKDAMLASFAADLGLDPARLPPGIRLRVEFVLSGFAGVLAYHRDMGLPGRPADTMAAVVPLVAQHILPVMLADLRGADAS